jgi:hypothetical protein
VFANPVPVKKQKRTKFIDKIDKLVLQKKQLEKIEGEKLNESVEDLRKKVKFYADTAREKN